MKRLINRVWREDEGVLTFEWILLITVLVIGIVGGLSAVRDATLVELGDVAEAMVSVDQSYDIRAPWEVNVPECLGPTEEDGASNSVYTDEMSVDNDRGNAIPTQGLNACDQDEDPT